MNKHFDQNNIYSTTVYPVFGMNFLFGIGTPRDVDRGFKVGLRRNGRITRHNVFRMGHPYIPVGPDVNYLPTESSIPQNAKNYTVAITHCHHL